MKINGPGESPLLLLNVIKLLNRLKIPYAVIGAFAASFYGVVRASLDVDAVISVKTHDEKMERLFTFLGKKNLKVSVRQGDAEDPVRGVVNIEDQFKNRVDLLTGIRGMPNDIYGRAVTSSFMGSSLCIVSIEDFIAMKIFAGSPKDILDVVGVLKISAKRIDLALLRQLTRLYGKKELERLEKLLKEQFSLLLLRTSRDKN